MNLQNKVAIVTGAASGLGLATCKELAAAGATVVGFDLEQTSLDKALGADMNGIAVDVSDESSVKAGIDAVVAMHGRVHVVVIAPAFSGLARPSRRDNSFPPACGIACSA